MLIDVNNNLNETGKSLNRQIVMQETKEKTKIENPRLYEFVYERGENSAEITIPTHLNFAEIPSYVENVQYQTLQTCKKYFEQDKKQLQNIPWKEVPIPPPRMNVKIIGENRNKQRKARQNEAKRFTQNGNQCKDEECKDENCERESSDVESIEKKTETPEITNVCTYCNKESKLMICNECIQNGKGIKLDATKSDPIGDLYIGAGAP